MEFTEETHEPLLVLPPPKDYSSNFWAFIGEIEIDEAVDPSTQKISILSFLQQFIIGNVHLRPVLFKCIQELSKVMPLIPLDVYIKIIVSGKKYYDTSIETKTPHFKKINVTYRDLFP